MLGGVGAVAGGGPGGEVFGGDWQGGLALVAAQVVQGAVAGDGGGPAAEAVVGPGKAGQVAGDLEPGFRGDVLGVLAGDGVQVAQQAGLQVPVQQPERLGITLLRLPQYSIKTSCFVQACPGHPSHDGTCAHPGWD